MKSRNNCISITLLVLMHFANAGYSQSLDQLDSICWCDRYKLTALDFEGVPPQAVKWTAITYASLHVEGSTTGGLPSYQVTNYFLRKKSWAKDTLSADLLEHEQLHFDLAEIFARKIRMTVERLRKNGEKNMDVYDRAIAALFDLRRKWSSAYDEETSHGLRLSKQKEWELKLKKELSTLSKYATECTSKTNTPCSLMISR